MATDALDSLMNLRDFAEDLKICARCGFCKNVCPTFKFSEGFEASSPRGRLFFLHEYLAGREKMTPGWVDRLYRCTSCERCMEVCQTKIPLVPLWEAARARTVKLGLGPMPVHVQLRESLAKFYNPYGEPLSRQRDWMLPGMGPADKAEIFVFGGCTASYRVPAMLRTGVQILQKAGIPYVYRGGGSTAAAAPSCALVRWRRPCPSFVTTLNSSMHRAQLLWCRPAAAAPKRSGTTIPSGRKNWVCPGRSRSCTLVRSTPVC